MLVTLHIADAPAEGALVQQPLVLSEVGILYVGGREAALTGAQRGRRAAATTQTQTVGQALVHYLIPTEEARAGKSPVVMVPGMGLTSYLYLGTPDGRDGWAQIFARAGHPVYVFDEPNNAIAGFDVNPFSSPQELTAPAFMRWPNETVWRRWGIGPEIGAAFEDSRYPVEQIGQLSASITPVYRAPGARFGAGAKAEALVELLEAIGPATLVLHSASGPTGLEATRMRPDLVNAIVAVEITGTPTDATDIREHFADKRFIGVFGDHFEVRNMAGRHEACQNTARLICDSGGTAEVIWLPELGIRGNSHLMMQETNNKEIADMILANLDD
jgi:pimeloyl-ACP methyl ester carboxylesterase